MLKAFSFFMQNRLHEQEQDYSGGPVPDLHRIPFSPPSAEPEIGLDLPGERICVNGIVRNQTFFFLLCILSPLHVSTEWQEGGVPGYLYR